MDLLERGVTKAESRRVGDVELNSNGIQPRNYTCADQNKRRKKTSHAALQSIIILHYRPTPRSERRWGSIAGPFRESEGKQILAEKQAGWLRSDRGVISV